MENMQKNLKQRKSTMVKEVNDQELVSIITPSYDSEAFIEEMIESVRGQTYRNWELLIVDDCSPDSSIEIVKRFAAEDPRIKFFELKDNSGAAVARNKAIGAAKGRYIAFLDSDDCWLPNKLEIQIAYMQMNRVFFTYSGYEVMSEEGESINVVSVPEKVNYSELLKTNYIGCLTAVYDTNFFGKVLMPLIRRRQDFGLWLTLLKNTDYAYGINMTLAKYRIRKGSISSNKATTSIYTWRLYREVEKLNFLKASYYFSHYFVRAVLRRKFPSLATRIGLFR